jgi:acyl-CoA dehydrogenase
MDGLLSDAASRLFADEVTQAVLAAAEGGAFPTALWTAIEAAGLDRALVPEAAGGFGVDPVEALSLLRLAGRAAAPVPLAETMLASWLLAEAGLELPPGVLTLASGEAMRLTRDGPGWRLSGTMHAVAWARDAVGIAVLAAAEGQNFAVLLPHGSFETEPGANMAGEPRDTVRCDARLTSAQVAPSDLGFVELRAAGAATRALMIAGALEEICEMSVRYAQERSQFGKPIGRFQAVQQNLAVLAGQAAAAGAAAEICAEGFAEGIALPAIAAGKLRAGEAAGAGAAIAHQVHGAIGFTREHALHRLTRRLWAWRDEYGGEAEWGALLGRHAAALGPERLWAGIAAL